MASRVQIGRLALQHIGDRYDINSLTEDSPEAEQVNLVFEDAREALLREHPWKFAKKYTTPAQLAGTPPAQWGYQFAYPTDAVRVWEIVNPLGRRRPPIPFDKAVIEVAGNDVQVLLADISEPEFMYTANVSEPNRFDANFSLALSWRIAELICIPITGDRDLRTTMRNEADTEVGLAMEADSNEGVEPSKAQDPDWIRVRTGAGSDTDALR